MPLLLFGQEDAQLPYLEARKDASGRYGYFDEEGNNVMPCIFDWALSFSRGHMVSVIEKDDLYYLVDRDGYLVVNDGFSSLPDVFVNFACVGDDKQGHYIIDFAGCRLSPEGWNVIPVERDSRYGDPVLFAMAPLGDEQNGYYLADSRFEPLSEVRASEYRHLIYCPEVIEYTDRSDGALCYGVMNAAGEVLVEAGPGTEWLEEERLSQLDELYDWNRKSGTYGLYSDEEQNNEMVFILCSGDGKSFMYDITGQEVVPAQKYKSNASLYKQNFKKYIAPYLRDHQQNRERFAERVAAPFDACESYAGEFAEKAVTRMMIANGSLARAVEEKEASNKILDGFFGMIMAMSGSTFEPAGESAGEYVPDDTLPELPETGTVPDMFDFCYSDCMGIVAANLWGYNDGFELYTVLDIGDKTVFESHEDPERDEKNGMFVIRGKGLDGDTVLRISFDWKRVFLGDTEFGCLVSEADYLSIIEKKESDDVE